MRLRELFREIIENYLAIIYRRIKIGSFTLSYNQISVVFPYILAAPSYFLKKITLGQFQQTANAFSSVQGSLSFFIDVLHHHRVVPRQYQPPDVIQAGDDEGGGPVRCRIRLGAGQWTGPGRDGVRHDPGAARWS